MDGLYGVFEVTTAGWVDVAGPSPPFVGAMLGGRPGLPGMTVLPPDGTGIGTTGLAGSGGGATVVPGTGSPAGGLDPGGQSAPPGQVPAMGMTTVDVAATVLVMVVSGRGRVREPEDE